MGLDDIDWDLYGHVEQAVEEGILEQGTAAYGIAQQVIHLGIDGLSCKQRYIYNKEVVPAVEEMAEQRYIRERCYNAPE